jgi:GTP cyclohydrolase I
MTAIDDAPHLELLSASGYPARVIDRSAAERVAAALLTALGANLEHEQLLETPRRMIDADAELLTPEPFWATPFPNDDGYDELVLVRSIPFHSLCLHHMRRFHGAAHVGYLPGERIAGLSKLARVDELFARDLQLQERLTPQIAGWVQEHLSPKGVGVVLEAEHLRMSFAGRAEIRCHDRHLCASRLGSRRPAHPTGVPRNHNKER